jgi:glycosyltransferase involved in cell wall biosynthesis
MEDKLISVIVPVYNVKRYLPHCVESIAHQSYRNLEIVLVDDGSTDGSGGICDEFAGADERIKVIHQENMGLWAARNTGQLAAHGEFLIFVDADDYIHSDLISTLHTSINASEDIDIAMIDYKKTTVLDEDQKGFLEGGEELLNQEEVILRYFQGSIAGCVWNKLFRRRVLEGVLARNYRRAQDQDYCLRVFLRAKKIVFVHKVMYFWVQHLDSRMHRSDYLFLLYKDSIDFYWRIMTSLTNDQILYERLFLKKLYRKLVLGKSYYFCAGHVDQVDFCDVFKKKITRKYWYCKDINFFEKIAMSILYYCPRIVYQYMIRTGNWNGAVNGL